MHPDFPAYASAFARFSVDPCALLGLTHSVDKASFLLACRLAADKFDSKTRTEEIKFQAELTSVRIQQRVQELWNGERVPPLSSLFKDESEPGVLEEGEWREY